VAKNFDTYGLGNKAQRLPVSEVINNYDRSEVIDPLTVKFYFKKPSPGFLQGTATIGSGLVSLSTLKRNFEELGDARHIIGSGPFVVKDEKLGREVTLEARLPVGAEKSGAAGASQSRRHQVYRDPGRQRARRRPAGRSGRLYSPGAGV
jgi:ABC-type transport system substrate-binding protein